MTLSSDPLVPRQLVPPAEPPRPADADAEQGWLSSSSFAGGNVLGARPRR